jgi:uncharacterized protein with HEPN domain
MKTDLVYCERMLDCIEKIERFVAGMRQKDFLESEMAQSGVIMQLTLIGELSKKLSDEFKKEINLPWKQIAGFRDKAVHDYYELDLEYVWLSIIDDLPNLKRELSRAV